MFEEVLEVTACFVDSPIETIREFIDTASDQIARLPELTADAAEERPAKLQLTATFKLDPNVQERHKKALEKLRSKLT